MKMSWILCVKHLNVVLCTDNMFSLTSLIVLSCSIFLTNGVPTKSAENLLNRIQLDKFPMAKCNDGSTAVYYRKPLNSDQDTKKLLIYLRGGEFCVPFVPGPFIISFRGLSSFIDHLWSRKLVSQIPNPIIDSAHPVANTNTMLRCPSWVHIRCWEESACVLFW